MGNDPETASLPIRVFHAVPEPPFSAAKNSLPGLDFTANLHVHKGFIGSCSLEGRQRAKRTLEGNPNQGFPSKSVRRASSEPAALEGGLGKAKPSMVASAVSGSFLFSIHTKWKRTVFIPVPCYILFKGASLARIKIKGLSRDLKVGEEEMVKIRGGIIVVNGRRLGPTGPDQVAFGSGGLTLAVVRLCM